VSGLLIDGELVPVPGVEIISPREAAWAHLNAGDGIPRSRRPQQAILHKTIADDPEHELLGAGKRGGDEIVAEMWANDPKHSGAHLVTGWDGRTSCLEDLVRFEAWHGNQANALSYGHEMKEVVGGGVYRATLDAAIAITLVATSAIGIQWQTPKAYIGRPLARFADGGRNLVGIFGHRDVTTSRNRWDPGEIVFARLRAAGVEAFDFEAREDLEVWGNRQRWLAREGHYDGAIDGIPGPKTTAALKAIGYPDGIMARWRELAELPPMPPGYGRR